MFPDHKNNYVSHLLSNLKCWIGVLLLTLPFFGFSLGWQKSMPPITYPYVNMQPTADDGLLNAECADNNCYTANVVKYSSIGTKQWETSFSMYSTTGDKLFINKMFELKNNNGYIIIYSSIRYSALPYLYYYRYAKLSNSGTLIYDRPITLWNGTNQTLATDSTSSPEIEYDQEVQLFYKTTIKKGADSLTLTTATFDTTFNLISTLTTKILTPTNFSDAYSMPYFPIFKGKGDYFYIVYTNYSLNNTWIAKINSKTHAIIYSNYYADFKCYDFTITRTNNFDSRDELEYNGDLVMSGYGVVSNPCPSCRYPSVLILDSIGNQKYFKTITSTLYEQTDASIQLNDSLIFQLGFFPDSIQQRNNFKRIYNINAQRYEFVPAAKFGRYDNDTLKMDRSNSTKIRRSYLGNHIYYSGAITKSSTSISLKALVKSDIFGNSFPYYIYGNIYGDLSSNCIKEIGEIGIKEYNIKAYRTNNTLFTTSDSNGNYEIGLDTTGYQIGLIPNINYPNWNINTCATPKFTNVNDNKVYDTINFGLNPAVLCPNLFVDISTSFLRRCFPATYTVYYSNNGTLLANNAYIDVTLDKYLVFNTASISYQLTDTNTNTYRFNIGDLSVLQSGAFTIDVTVDCDSTIIGQTHCVEAHIFPDTVCSLPLYNGPVISAFVICKGDSVEFKLKNEGADMQSPKNYIVIEDDVMRRSNTFQLPRGGEIYIPIATTNGHTFRIEAEQDSLFPPDLGDNIATAFIEGCRDNPNSPFTTGYVTQYPEYDGEPFRSIDCQQNRGSFDPNDKIGYPIGYDTANYILPNTSIEYKINFQNTGTDTAFNIVIYDKISRYLDINTLKPEASSHPYTYQRIDSTLVKFTFENINIVDSVHNEPKSHGFIKFNIKQKKDNPVGTIIYNNANIYFDRNMPIATNTTRHTIGVNFLKVDIIQDVINSKYELKTAILYPNPFTISAILELKTTEIIRNAQLIIMNSTGNIVQTNNNILNNKFKIDAQSLTKGIYLYNIMQDDKIIATGKMVLQ